MAERYEILGKLARGGIGAIYRAKDKVMGREVALKRLLPIEETHLNESADESLQREAAALARFQHPNVVTIYAFEEDEEGSYVAMELVEGENLKETIERGALAVDDFIELTLQTLDPLIAAKDMDLMHRDIKPSNIMLTWQASGRFQVKVLDFGLAKFSQAPSTQTLDQTGSFLGSIDYLAPEQLELAPLDQRTDLYSLGCVLYYCLTQQPPFEGKNAAETMTNHLKQKLKPLREFRPDVPQPLADWVMRMISRFPRQRPADARAALKEFHAALKGESPPEPAAEKTSSAVEIVEDLPFAKRIDEPVNTAPKLVVSKPEATGGGSAQNPKLITGSSGSPPAKKVAAEPSKPPGAPPVSPSARSAPASQPGQSKRKLAVVAVASTISACLIFYFLFFNGDDDSDDSGGSEVRYPVPPTREETEKSKAKAAPPRPERDLPAMKNPATRDEVAAAVPAVTEGLVAHYAASDATMTQQRKQFIYSAEPGSIVKAWGNIAGDAASDHLLAVATQNQKGPTLISAKPQDHPELKGATPVLRFEPGTQFTSVGKDPANKLARSELTIIAVLRSTSNGGTLIRIDPASRITPLLKLEIVGGGGSYRSTMDRGSFQPTATTRIGEAKGKFLIVSMTWLKDVQRHILRLPNGERVFGQSGEAPWSNPPKPAEYTLCHGASVDVAEWLIYNRALPDADRESVEDQLYEKYFRPDFTLTHTLISAGPDGQPPEIRNPKDATPSIPPPPVTEGLIGHYAASDGTLGFDMTKSPPPGGKVFAWANFAPGAADDHLLAFKSGQERRTPTLKMESAPVLEFASGSLLESRSNQPSQKIDKRQFTGFLVVKPDGNSGPIFQMDADKNGGVFTLIRSAEGFGSRMKMGGKKTSQAVAKVSNEPLSILSFSWNGADKQHRIFVRQAAGESVSAEPAEGPAGPLTFTKYRIGVAPPARNAKNAKNAALFGGQVAELLLYGRALDEAERKQVENYLHGRHLAR